MKTGAAVRVVGLLVCAGAAACARDTWVYDARVSADAAEVGSYVTTPDAPALDAGIDAPTVDGPTVDVPTVDVPAVDVSTAPPRPLSPLSLGDVTQRRPTLRWQLPAGSDGAAVDLCRDRACTSLIETLTVTGGSARPTSDLAPRSVVFWRLRGRSGATVNTGYGPTWLFHVPVMSASTAVDTSSSPHLDVNGDGYADVVVGQSGTDSALVYLGGASATPLGGAPVTLHGHAGSGFGAIVANAGDVNGDGYGDVVVGAWGASPGERTMAGEASVFLGGAAGVATTASVVLEGVGPNDRFGTSAAAGDFNADGYSDLAVGAYLADPGGRIDAGTVSVFLGGAAGTGGAVAIVLGGVAAGDYLGAVAGVGDVNGDGYGDLAVGAAHGLSGAHGWAGNASVFHGGAAGITATAALVVGGNNDTDFASSVEFVGDVNGDGYSDLVVGAPNGYSPTAGNRPGYASVFLGGASGVASTPAAVVYGALDGAYFGYNATGGDVNGDGYADLVVGALFDSPSGRFRAGSASVFGGGPAGVASAPTRVLEGVASGDQFGGGLRVTGDVNNDGYADLVVGSPHAGPGGRSTAGTARVFPGSAAGLPMTPAGVLEGATAGGTFGEIVASVGKVRGGARRSLPAG